MTKLLTKKNSMLEKLGNLSFATWNIDVWSNLVVIVFFCFVVILLIILTHSQLCLLRIFVQFERIFNTRVKYMLFYKRNTSTVYNHCRAFHSKTMTNAFISVSIHQMTHQTSVTCTYLIKAPKRDESTKV